MTEFGVLSEGRAHRAELRTRELRSRRRRRLRYGLIAVVLALATPLAAMVPSASEPGSRPAVHPGASHAIAAQAVRTQPTRSGYGIALARTRISVRRKLRTRSGLLFDVRSGRVLWTLRPGLVLPIASLTKMMTGLVVVQHARRDASVLITRAALQYAGSGVGLLPLGKRVSVETLLYGLLLPSGNDAAIALARHVAGTEARFVAIMNARARSMGLRCTRFTSASGIVDQGNHSCVEDLAILAHAVLRQPLLAQIVSSPSATLPFPIKGGKLYLYNNNPLLRLGYLGADGVKTGYTGAAGLCLVATARRGRKWLGVALLHSSNPSAQAQELLDAGFAASLGKGD
jgi:D-alanyl-D-alanine carboxypeptidase